MHLGALIQSYGEHVVVGVQQKVGNQKGLAVRWLTSVCSSSRGS